MNDDRLFALVVIISLLWTLTIGYAIGQSAGRTNAQRECAKFHDMTYMECPYCDVQSGYSESKVIQSED